MSFYSISCSYCHNCSHAHDKGWGGEAASQKKKGGVLPTILIFVVAAVAALAALGSDEEILPKLAAVACALLTALSARRVAAWQPSIPEKQPILAILLVLFGVLVNAVIVFVSPVSDLWYYLGDAACILILVLASVVMMRVYNIGTTRPLPKLFDREEVR